MTYPFRWTSTATACLGMAILLTGGLSAHADNPDLAGELLEELHKKGDISDARYEELKSLDQAPPAETPAVSSDEPTWDAYWSNGFKVERSDKAFKLKFGGRIMNDWAAIDYSDELKKDLGIGDGGLGTEFRRARIYFSGTVYERLFFKAQYDFAGGDADIKDMYMGLNFGDTNVRVGHFKEPFSLEEQTSSKYITFMERGLPNAFSPSRNTGIQVQHRFMENRGTFSTGFFVVTDDYGDRDIDGWSNDNNYDIASRVTFLPFYEDEGEKLVHLGFAHVHGFRNDQTTTDGAGITTFDEPVGFDSRPESHLADDLVMTPDIPAVGTELIGAELAAVLGPFAFQSEYMHTWVNGDSGARSTAFGNGAKNYDYWGIYAQASYFLTGEHRNYDKKTAAFARVKPIKNFNPSTGDWGAFEVAIRFSRLDLRDRGVGSKLNDYTLGLNWYLFPNARIMANYIHGDRSAGGNVDLGQVRFQLDF